MVLYRPTEEEITLTLGRAAGRAPSLRTRLEHAGILLRTGALAWDGNRWNCAGEGDGGRLYTVSFTSCDCEDFRLHRAGSHGETWCRHRLALLAYREILVDHLHQRHIGRLLDKHDAHTARCAANAALVLGDDGCGGWPALFAWAESRRLHADCICAVAPTPKGLVPQDEGHMAAFAAWLAQADPLPAELDALQTYRRLRALGLHDEEAAAAADLALVPVRLAA